MILGTDHFCTHSVTTAELHTLRTQHPDALLTVTPEWTAIDVNGRRFVAETERAGVSA